MTRPLPTEPLLDVDVARARVLERVHTLDPVSVPLDEAVGLVVAEDVRAPHPMPRFDNSAMDGYAVRSADVQSAPTALAVIGEVKAGAAVDVEVTTGTATRIMTGGAVPPGADAVVEVEATDRGRDRVVVTSVVAPGRNVRPAGDDFEAGALLVGRGTEVGPGEAALLASIGATPVSVHRRPRVAVLVTGDEIVPPERDPQPGQIRDSNSIALRALLRATGAEVTVMERIPDTLDAHVASFERAAGAADLVVSSGGVAVGDFDFVKDAVEKLGSIDLWRVAMQPGKPVVLGEIGGIPFLGLPGNPVSVHVGFEQFVRPALRKMLGHRELLRPTIEARLTEAITKRPGRLHFVRVRLSRSASGWDATPTGPQGSHVQTSLVDCHGVARFGKDESELPAGAGVVVEVWRLPGD
ncbi:MAG: molybdopterin molybdotransferase MoeA [Actinobacteria bacterium]|nr:molybdopterin molybdotransferase MoeA [Actinomycetota bacterium]